MKKIVSILLLFILTASVLAGCHGSKGLKAFEVPEQFDTSKNYEITFWAKNDNNKTQVAIYNKAVQDFQALYPNITVNVKFYTDYGRIYNDVITNISTATTPNICITYPDHIATYLTGVNVVAPLDELFSDEKYGFGGSELKYDSVRRDEVIDKFLNEGVLSGASYAIPFMRSSEACYINQDLVEALGYTIPDELTWDFIWEVSDAAMALGKDSDENFILNGQKVLIPFIYKSTDNMMIQMLKQKNAGYTDENGDILIFNDTTRELLLEIASHVQNRAFSTFKIDSYPGNFLNAGQCIFAIDSTAGATWMGSNAPLTDIHKSKVQQFTTVVRSVPQFDTSSPKMISQGPSICIFNKNDPQEVLASWLFAQFLLTNDVQIAYSQTEGYVPVTLKARQSDEYIDYLAAEGADNDLHYDVKIKATRILLEHTDDTFVTPVWSGSASLRDAAGELIESVTKSVRRKETVDEEYLDKLFADITSLYRLDQLSSRVGSSSDRTELGPLPKTASTLFIVLAAAWVCIGAYALYQKKKNKG